MNFIEASRELVGGKKIRLCFWGEGKYLQKTSFFNYVLLNEFEKEYQIQLVDVLRDDWEIYEEQPKLHTFNEAIKLMKEGKNIKRKLWTTKVIERDFCDDYSIEFAIDDFEANDWVIVEGEE